MVGTLLVGQREWYIPNITIGFDTKYKDETDRYLDILTETLKNDNN